MNVFFLELWHDLREKRLVPVAAVLLLAVVTVPAVMLKSSSGDDGAGSVPAPGQTAGAAGRLPVELSSASDKGSKLKTFDPRNPFKPGVKVSDGTASSVVSRAEGSLAGTSGTDGAGNGNGKPSGGGGGVSHGTPGTTAPTTLGAPTTKTSRFTYVIDVTFVENGRVSRRKGLRRLAMLPNQDAPLLLFLGADNKADNALFLVDSTLKTFGEGSCKPSAAECGVLSLGSGAEHEFTDADNNSYGIRIDEIRRVTTKRAAKAARARARASASAGTTPKRRFVPPFLTDIETTTTTGAGR